MNPERKNILIVDDIEINRIILYELFHNQYNVLEAENGEIALNLIAEYGSSIAVVLLDIVMPEIDGFGVLRQMIKDSTINKMPVIMITASSDEEMALKGYSMGVVDIINKPFNPDIVSRRVQNTVDLFLHKYYLEDMVERQTKTLEQQNDMLRMSNSFIIDALSTAVEFRNQESGQHIRRMHALSKMLLNNLAVRCKRYNLSSDKIGKIADASAMHDIGKIAIADAILLKPGRLTAEEFEIMKTHTTKGCEILQSINFTGDQEYFRYCYDICRYHHERWDGKGYPDGLIGDEIPICAQVVSLSDVYDALVSDRVYKSSFPHEIAVEMIISGECGEFNPELIQAFIETAPDFQDRETVQLYSVPSFKPIAISSMDTDTNTAKDSHIMGELYYEKSKFIALTELSNDAIFEYEISTDTIKFSGQASAFFPFSLEIEGFRHAIITTAIVKQEHKALLLDEVMKLNRQKPLSVFGVDVLTKSGDFERFIVTVKAVFDSNETADKMAYIGKLTNLSSVHT